MRRLCKLFRFLLLVLKWMDSLSVFFIEFLCASMYTVVYRPYWFGSFGRFGSSLRSYAFHANQQKTVWNNNAGTSVSSSSAYLKCTTYVLYMLNANSLFLPDLFASHSFCSFGSSIHRQLPLIFIVSLWIRSWKACKLSSIDDTSLCVNIKIANPNC